MKKLFFTLSTLFALTAVNQSFSFSYSNQLPQGSYQETCHACAQHNGNLSCLCDTHHGYPMRLTAFIPDRCDYVERQHHQLVCTHFWHPRRPHVHLAEFSAGPIWSNFDAQGKCRNVCEDRHASWTGQWHTIVEGENSVCECRVF